MKKNLFNSVMVKNPRYNKFDMSHDVKTSLNFGDLAPIMLMECVPGDRINIEVQALMRFQPLIAPVMHRMNVYMHYWFVPNRLLWDNWEKFITNTPLDGISGPLPAFPTIQVSSGYYSKLADYLGVPTPLEEGAEVINALPFYAYQLVYDLMYRDQNLIVSDWSKALDGDQGIPEWLLKLRKRAWQHDYFTASLPFAQKGEAVDIPLGDVRLKDLNAERAMGGIWRDYQDENLAATGVISGDAITGAARAGAPGAGSNRLTAYDPNGTLETEPTTINSLRRAFRLQEWLEKAARAGSRYAENIRAFFGITPEDSRLQRPEYIAGSMSPCVISEVLNTTGTDTAPQGTMAGHGVSVTAGRQGSYRCKEHGFVIGIASVLPLTGYQQGLEKHWLKYQDPFQYFWPQFAHLGEQEVQNREVYAYQADSDLTFGYVPRYSEYKFINNKVSADMRSTLDFWHMSRKFATPPHLNQTFIECNPDYRQFAVTDPGVDHLLMHVYNKVSALRPMPVYGTPTF